jgi:hypothetical protein
MCIWRESPHPATGNNRSLSAVQITKIISAEQGFLAREQGFWPAKSEIVAG